MKRVLGLGVLLLACGTAGWSYTINLLSTNALWNTGFQSDGTYGGDNQQDGHYNWLQWDNVSQSTVIGSGNAHIIDRTGFPIPPWRPNLANTAAWISTAGGPPNPGPNAGYYSFYTTFELPTDFPFWNLSLQFDVWADNAPTFVGLLSGNNANVGGWQNYPVSAPSGFLAYVNPGVPSPDPTLGYLSSYNGGTGLNLSATGLTPGFYTLRFDVFNAPGAPINPTGLFVKFSSATAEGVPEPSSLVFLASAAVSLIWFRRRKAARAATGR